MSQSVTPATAFAWWRTFAASRAALVVVGAWGFAEAIAWPIIPDFIILPLALAVPSRWFAFALAALAGSLSGGLVSYLLGATAPGPYLLDVAPLVTDSMKDGARSALHDDGALGLMAQPLSGIPYKVFAYQAALAGVGIIEYAVLSAVVRGSRFLAVALVGAVAGKLLRKWWERFWPWFCVLYCAAFLIGLSRVVAGWQ